MTAQPGHGSEQWRTDLADRFNGLTALSMDRAPLGHVRSIPLDDIAVHQVRGIEQTLLRSARSVRQRPTDLLKVCLMVQGHATIEQDGVVVDIGPGEFALYDTSRPYRLTNHDVWRVRVMTVDRHDLTVSAQHLRRLMQRAISTQDGPGQLYAGFLAGLTDSPTPNSVSHVRAAGVALLSAALTESLDRAVEVGPDVVVTQLLRHVEGHLGDPALSLSGVAAAHHMSPRSLQRLLAGEGLTFSCLVRSRRLELIRRDLVDPANAHRSIAAVAARWGVLDQPWLSRAFRAAYGMSPKQFRSEAAQCRALNAASAGSLSACRRRCCRRPPG